jgi:hypothetical protein
MITIPNRIIIEAKDVTNMTGKKRRTAQKFLAAIREENQKAPGDMVTVFEFSAKTKIGLEIIAMFVK